MFFKLTIFKIFNLQKKSIFAIEVVYAFLTLAGFDYKKGARWIDGSIFLIN